MHRFDCLPNAVRAIRLAFVAAGKWSVAAIFERLAAAAEAPSAYSAAAAFRSARGPKPVLLVPRSAICGSTSFASRVMLLAVVL